MALTVNSDRWKAFIYNDTTYNVFWEENINLDYAVHWTVTQHFSTVNASSLNMWDFVFVWKADIASTTATTINAYVAFQWYRDWVWETLHVPFDKSYSIEQWWNLALCYAWYCSAAYINSTMTDYRITYVIWNKFWTDSFSITNAPYWTTWIWVDASSTWKSLIVDWSVVQTAYWKTFNREPAYSASSWNAEWRASWESSFNLTNFQIWNEVLCFALTLIAWTATQWEKVTTKMRLQKMVNGVWTSNWTWEYTWTDTFTAWLEYAYSWYMWIDKDEIWDDASDYRLRRSWDWDKWHGWYTYTFFMVTNLNIDTTVCKSWYLWVEWNNLCYTDNILDEVWRDGYWYKHKIWYESYSDYVGTDKAWSIRIQSSWTYPNRIHYVDSSWYHRVTSNPLWWYGWYSTASWAEWCIWVWAYSYLYWYGYLCYVDNAWTKHRIMNPDLSS